MNYMDIQNLNNKNYMNGRNSYLFTNKNYSANVNMLENEAKSGVGYINLNVITGLENIPLQQAIVVIYVRQTNGILIPIMTVMTTLSPILIQLPVLYSPGTLSGPADDVHSIYNLTITAEGYYTTRILNVRMFDDVVTDFNINMIPVIKEYSMPEAERIIEIPPLPVY